MTPIQDKVIMKRRYRAMNRRRRLVKKAQRKKRMRVWGLRLSERLRMDLQKSKEKRKLYRLKMKQRYMAKRETAKLNRTLKRRRKK